MVKLVWFQIFTFDEIVGAPLYGVQGVIQLPLGLQLRPVLKDAPRQHGDRKGQRQAKLDIVTGIVVPTNQINLQNHRSKERMSASCMYQYCNSLYLSAARVASWIFPELTSQSSNRNR